MNQVNSFPKCIIDALDVLVELGKAIQRETQNQLSNGQESEELKQENSIPA